MFKSVGSVHLLGRLVNTILNSHQNGLKKELAVKKGVTWVQRIEVAHALPVMGSGKSRLLVPYGEPWSHLIVEDGVFRLITARTLGPLIRVSNLICLSWYDSL